MILQVKCSLFSEINDFATNEKCMLKEMKCSTITRSVIGCRTCLRRELRIMKISLNITLDFLADCSSETEKKIWFCYNIN